MLSVTGWYHVTVAAVVSRETGGSTNPVAQLTLRSPALGRPMASGSKSLHFIFYTGTLTLPPFAIVTREKLY